MKVSATEFKAKCLSLIDLVETNGEIVTITKHGRVVAKLVSADARERPWLSLRGAVAEWHGNPFAPAVDPDDVEALK